MQDANITENELPAQEPAQETKTYSREYVEELRRENAKYRVQRNEYSQKYEGAEKKASEYDAMIKKQQEEQGKYKELYEGTVKQVEELKRYESRVQSLEGVFSGQLDELKKSLKEDDIKLIDDLPAEMSIEQKLNWARKLVGNGVKTQSAPDLRGGGDNVQSIDNVMKKYMEGDSKTKMEILFAVEKTNPTLYNSLINS